MGLRPIILTCPACLEAGYGGNPEGERKGGMLRQAQHDSIFLAGLLLSRWQLLKGSRRVKRSGTRLFAAGELRQLGRFYFEG